MQAEQDARFEEDVWTDDIRTFLQGCQQTTIMQVARNLNFTTDRVGTRDQRRIAAILRNLGWKEERSNAARGWVPRVVLP